MGILDLFKRQDISERLKEAASVEGAVVLDVRGRDEFRRGHIPGAINIPTDELGKADELIPDKSTHIFAYCLIGARSKKAAAVLKEMGYTNAVSIGGINGYSGEICGGDF